MALDVPCCVAEACVAVRVELMYLPAGGTVRCGMYQYDRTSDGWRCVRPLGRSCLPARPFAVRCAAYTHSVHSCAATLPRRLPRLVRPFPCTYCYGWLAKRSTRFEPSLRGS